jgi:NAD(P)-dependent dehydrogenase (short-subunit alcohol dehydrogenase family)
MSTLTGRVAAVTGGASGIGRAICAAFAAEGCAVGVLDQNEKGSRETAEQLSADGSRAIALTVDVTVADEVEQAIDDVVGEFGQLDILVNDAGIGQLGTIEELSEDDWDQVMAVNLKSIYLCSRAAMPHLVESQAGRIINVASVTGLVASAGRAAYCASKGGAVMLTKAMALDCAPKGVTVNAICPGVVETAMTASSLRDLATRQEKLDKTPLGRLAVPEEIAPAAVFLASTDAGFVTGACLAVDGGWSAD